MNAETIKLLRAVHIHKWQTAGPWGVILGVCKCELCGKTAEGKDFDHSREDKPHPGAEGGKDE